MRAVAPRRACCVPITQPRMMPKHMPEMAKTMESDLMERAGSACFGILSNPLNPVY